MNNSRISKFTIIKIILVTLFLFSNVSASEKSRIRFSINNNWVFKYFNNENEFSIDTFEQNSTWQNVNLPHTWNINDTPTDTSKYKQGIGLYEKSIKLSNNLKGKRIFINFEGANQFTKVLINGIQVGEHIGGYTAFTFEITDLVRFDKKESLNKISVIVDNRFNQNIPPLSADFTFFGGIYRDVWLIATESIHFSLADHGSNGVFISTPQVSKDSAIVEIKGLIDNQTEEAKEIIVINKIVDAIGIEISQIKSSYTIEPRRQLEFTQISNTIINPKLWTPEDPFLYKVYTEIYDSEKLLDRVKNKIGFRYFSFDSDQGIFLNGEYLKLIGTNRHQDCDGVGNALPNQQHVEDLINIKEAGFNFLRLAHYPQDPAVLEAADSLGLIIWEEIPIINYVSTTEEFKTNSKYMLKEMIRQHYNHPSVFFWGFMNEIFLHDANGNREKNNMFFPDEYLQWTVLLASELNELAIEEDSTRLTTMAIHQSEIYNETGIASIPQALGYNLYPGWYFGKMSSMGKFLDEEHVKYPNRRFILSEYGAGSDERLHSENPQPFDFTTEYQQLFHENYYSQIIKRKYLGASAVWAQNDFRSDRRGDSKSKINQKGLQYYNRKLKDIYYFYKASLVKNPIIHIASRDWDERIAVLSDFGEADIPVKIYTNLIDVDISLNDRSFGSFVNEGSNIINIDLPLRLGQNKILVEDQEIFDSISINLRENISNLKTISKGEEIAINIGASNQFIDSNGLIWIPENEYKKDLMGYIGGKPKNYSTSPPILGTDNDPLYQTYRVGIESFKFDVPDGEYEIELCFVEDKNQEVDTRCMSISLNDELKFDNLDLVKNYGFLNAVNIIDKIFVKDGKGINISFDSIIGQTTLSAIRVKML